MSQVYTPAGATRGYHIPNRLTDSTDVEAWFKQVVDDIETYLALMAPKASPSFTGSVGIGTTAASQALDVRGVGANVVSALRQFTADANSAEVRIVKSRGTTDGSFTVVQSGDQLGNITIYGTDGAANRAAASIAAYVDGTPGSSDMPGRLVFSVTADGAATPTEAMRLSNVGYLGVGTSAPGARIDAVAESTSALGLRVRGRSSDGIGIIQFTDNGATAQKAAIQVDSATPVMKFLVSSTVMAQMNATGTYLSGFLQTGLGVSTGDVQHEFGGSRTGDGSTYIDLHSTNGADYEARLIRSSGANGATSLTHKGTGTLSITTENAAAIALTTNNITRLFIDSAGAGTFVNDSASPDFSLRNRAGAGATQPVLSLQRQGVGAAATPNSSTIGELRFAGVDAAGTPAYAVFASITATIGTNAAGGAPTYLTFNTAPSGATVSERMRIDSVGAVGIGTVPVGTAKLSLHGALRFTTNITASDIYTGIGAIGSDVLGFATAGTTRLTIDASGNVGIGTTNPTIAAGAGPLFVIESATAFGPQQAIRNITNDGNSPYLMLEKSRSGGIIQSNDAVGSIQFRGHDGVTMRALAAIQGVVDGTPGSSDMPGRLVFLTTADGASTPTEQMRIANYGTVGIGTTNPSSAFKLDVNGGFRSLDVVVTKTASYTLSSADWGKRHDCNHASTQINVTLPSDTTDASMPLQSSTEFVRVGAAAVAFVADTGVTINYDTTLGLKVRAQWQSAWVTKTASNTYLVRGDISA